MAAINGEDLYSLYEYIGTELPTNTQNLVKALNARNVSRKLAEAIYASVDIKVIAKGTLTPPTSPANGDTYVIGNSPTGAWAGSSNRIAIWNTTDSVWKYIDPSDRMSIVTISTPEIRYYYRGTYPAGSWVASSSGGGPTQYLVDIFQGLNILVDKTDPFNPVISTTGVLTDIFAGTNINIDKTNPEQPIISALTGTTAGSIIRVSFTGDQVTTTQGTFYLTNRTNQGTVASVMQSVTLGASQTLFFPDDALGEPYPVEFTIPSGIYSAQLSTETDLSNAQRRLKIEVYLAAADGTPIASGVTGMPNGDLGVPPISILDSGIFDLAKDTPVQVNLDTYLTESVVVAAGQRMRYHISAEKVGTSSTQVVQKLYFGSDYNSHLDAPALPTTDTVINRSNVGGIIPVSTNTEALESLVEFRGNWDKITYPKNKMVLHQGYLAVSNKETKEAPNVVQIGTPEYLMDNWSPSNSPTTGVVHAGNIWTFNEPVEITSISAKVATINSTTKYSLVIDDYSSGDINRMFINDLQLEEDAFKAVFNKTLFFQNNAQLAIYLVARNVTSTTQYTGDTWNYKGLESDLVADPGSTNWKLNAKKTQLAINKNSVEGDQSTNLGNFVVGTTIKLEKDASNLEEYHILGITDNTTYYTYEVALIDKQGAIAIDDVVTLDASIPTLGSVDLLNESNYWTSNAPSFASVTGYESINGASPTFNPTGFGVDIKVQQIAVSPDWDYLSILTGGVGETGATTSSGLKTIYVSDDNGDDSTAEKYNPNKPYKSLQTACNVSVAGDRIEADAGTYNLVADPNNFGLSKAGVSYYFHLGARVISTGRIWGRANGVCTVEGYGVFEMDSSVTNTGEAVVKPYGVNDEIYIKCLSIINESDAARAIDTNLQIKKLEVDCQLIRSRGRGTVRLTCGSAPNTQCVLKNAIVEHTQAGAVNQVFDVLEVSRTESCLLQDLHVVNYSDTYGAIGLTTTVNVVGSQLIDSVTVVDRSANGTYMVKSTGSQDRRTVWMFQNCKFFADPANSAMSTFKWETATSRDSKFYFIGTNISNKPLGDVTNGGGAPRARLVNENIGFIEDADFQIKWPN